ncbi:EAL domain-containing protein [Rhizobium sp. AQ_MP]|uniref:putative bifunctional diguanylate cyclase/phosphodiesterase n=1 Tax=Rhizobium sp. AQ_MP TaxID=2761536 RepID=UPI0016395C8E|nr:EAL domain-containing protein [Rhizobium sp. AQ_MP]MBC2774366.1 EAL domain-containing protein [Rhizobium sp. AQ_MP]
MIRIYQAVSLTVAAFALLWTVIFLIDGHWLIAAVEFFPVIAGLVCFALVTSGRLDLFLIVAQSSFLVFIIGFSLMFDVPQNGAPRVTHLFLPVLGMLAYLNYLRRPSRLQLALIACSLVTFVVLHAADLRLPFAQPVPPELHAIGVWLNPTMAALVFCGTIYALQQRLSAPRGIARDLMAALRQGQLTLVYQPQTDRDGHVLGGEALLRWNHPTRGPVPPATFIPAAEEMGLMPIVGTFVLEQALSTLTRWKDDPRLSTLTLSVNVSASQFNEADFETTLRDLLQRHEIDPTRLRLELTESVLIAGLEPVAEKMTALKALGLTFSLDDFGTGFSSLAYLRRLPVSELKIDRSFVAAGAENERDAALVRSIRAIAVDLGLETVAEGVETQAQLAFLETIGCRIFQGYLFGRPMPLEEFEQAVLAPKPRPVASPERPSPRLAAG